MPYMSNTDTIERGVIFLQMIKDSRNTLLMLSIPSKKIWVIIFPIDAPTKTNRLVEHKLTFKSLHLK